MRARVVWPTAILVAAAIAVVVGGWIGPAAGSIAGIWIACALRRMEPVEVRRARRRAAVDLPVAVDLLAAALRAGAPVDQAVSVVGESLGGPLGLRLLRVGRALRVGLPPAEAWQTLADVPGTRALIRTAVHSCDSGTGMTTALDRMSADIRAERLAAAEAAVRRASVAAVVPLGLCFLPAFLLTSLVPVLVAVLGTVLGRQ